MPHFQSRCHFRRNTVYPFHAGISAASLGVWVWLRRYLPCFGSKSLSGFVLNGVMGSGSSSGGIGIALYHPVPLDVSVRFVGIPVLVGFIILNADLASRSVNTLQI